MTPLHSSTRKRLTPAKLRAAIMRDWYALESVVQKTNDVRARDFLYSALKESERVEREHRAMGRRFTDGRARYSVSVDTAARYMVVKWAGSPEALKPLTPPDLMSLRTDVAYCYALKQTLKANGHEYSNIETSLVDYSGDIALG